MLIMALIIGLVMIISVASNILTNRSFATLEQSHAREHALRLKNVYDHELQSLTALAADWAYWDDTYRFVDDRNAEYLEVNYVDATFDNLDLNLAVIADRSGDIIFSKTYDAAAGQETSAPDEMKSRLPAQTADLPAFLARTRLYEAASRLLARIAVPSTALAGILNTSDGLLLVAVQPILTSERAGPPRGTLIFGRWLDQRLVERLQTLTGVEISLARWNAASPSPDFEAARDRLADPESVFVHVLDSNHIAAYTILEDVFGDPAAIVRTVDIRDVYRRSLESQTLFTALLILFAGMFSLIIFQLIARMRDAGLELSNILNGSSDAIAVVQPDGAIVRSNAAFDSVYGAGRASILDVVGSDQRDEFARLLRKAADRQPVSDTTTMQVHCAATAGYSVEAEAVLSPIQGKPRRVQRVIVTLHDISIQKKMEQHLRSALEREMEINQLKTKALSVASHEFRTPLAVILTSVEILERYSERLTAENYHKHLARIRSAVEEMNQLAEDVLTHIRTETGRLEVRPQPLDVNALCREIIDELAPGSAEAPEIDFSPSEQTEPVELDPGITTLVVRNLLSNAVKYTPAGKMIHVEIRQDREQTTLTVRDEGVGIPPEEQPRLFTPFFRASNVGDTPGSGLGLSIVKQAVKLCGGAISLESIPGAGTTVRVTLPHFLGGNRVAEKAYA